MKFLIILIFISIANYAMANSQNIEDLKLELRYAVAGNKWREMIEVADKILKLKPKDPGACFEKAQGLAQLGRYKEAIVFYDLAVEYKHHYSGIYKHHYSGIAYYHRGVCLESLERYEDALESYDLAIKHGYNDRWLYFARNGVLLKLGRLGKNSD
ncbi:MAG: tetratricopeptide repeat protein [Pseudomonadota bacterium]